MRHRNAVCGGWQAHARARGIVTGTRCLVLWLVVGTAASVGSAAEVWQFVDGDGVVHMGNATAPAAAKGVIWLGRVTAAPQSGPPQRTASAQQFSGYEAAKPLLESAARSQSIEPALVIAVAAAESAFNADAVSHKGALGLMQVMPATAERYGVAAKTLPDGKPAAMEPRVNAQIGSRYLADLLRMFDGDKELALAAYNAGEGAVIKHGRRIPPYPETQQYVERVMRYYRNLLR